MEIFFKHVQIIHLCIFVFVVGRFRIFSEIFEYAIGTCIYSREIEFLFVILFVLCLERPSIIYNNRIIPIGYINLNISSIYRLTYTSLLDNVSKT